MITVQFQKVQTDDRNVNQLQSNILSSLNTIGNDLNQISIVGEVKFSPLTLSQFQSQAGNGWVYANGQTSIIGSQYNKLTQALVAPAVTAPSGTFAYIRIN